MTIDQLWFGWAAKGAEGVNKQQIIARSEALADSRDPRTIQVLASCYAPPRLAFGWMDHPSQRVVFRRRIAGRDGRGRPGRFFVHALVADPTSMPPPLLARLWSAGIWADDAPPEPDPLLATLGGPDELMLGDAPPAVEEEQLRALLAAHLWNLARGGRSALDVDVATAVAIAAALSQVLPPGLALRGFSTEEAESQAQKYDLIAGSPPTGQFVPIALDSSVSPSWQAAASLLLEAAHGDVVAEGAVKALGRQATTSEAFAASLHRWAAIDRLPCTQEELSPRELAGMLEQVARSTELVLRLVDGAGAARVADAFVARVPAARAVIGTAASNDRDDALVAALQPSLIMLKPGQALVLLEGLAEVAPSVYGRLLSNLAETWTADGSAWTLQPAEALLLVRNLLGVGTPEGLVEELVRNPGFAGTIANARDIPAGYRALAVASVPSALPAAALAAELADQPGFAEVLLDAAQREILDAVAAAVDVVPPRDALRVAKACERFVGAIDVEEWLWSAYRRSPPPERLIGTSALVRRRGAASAVWTERLLDTYVETVKEELCAGTTLQLLEVALIHETSARSSAWKEVLTVLQRDDVTLPGMARVVHQEAQYVSPEDREVMSEIAVDRILTRWRSEQEFEQAIRELRTGESRAIMALRLARAAQRRRVSPAVVAAVVIWIARRIHQELLPTSALNDTPVASLQVLEDPWRTRLLEMRAQFDSPKELKRWLKAVLGVGPRFRLRIPRLSRP